MLKELSEENFYLLLPPGGQPSVQQSVALRTILWKGEWFPPCCGWDNISQPYFTHSHLGPSGFDPLVPKAQENTLPSL